MKTIVIDNNILNCLSKCQDNLNLFIKQINKNHFLIYLPYSLLSESIGSNCKNNLRVKERADCLLEMHKKCKIELCKFITNCLLKEIRTKGKAKELAFYPKKDINQIFSKLEYLIDRIKKTDKDPENPFNKDLNKDVNALDLPENEFQQNHIKGHSCLFLENKTHNERIALYNSFIKHGFNKDNSLHEDFIKYCIKKWSDLYKKDKQENPIKNKNQMIKYILNESERYKFWKTFIALMFVFETKGRGEITCNAFNDKNKTRKDTKLAFLEELKKIKNPLNDEDYILFSSYSNYLITNDRMLREKCKDISVILTFSAISFEEFLKLKYIR